MKPGVDTESGSNNSNEILAAADGEAVTGIRTATANDPPTEEIDLAEAEAAAESESEPSVPSLEVAPAPPPLPAAMDRRTSVPPPLPAAALRARLPPPAVAGLGLSPLGQLLPPAKQNGSVRPSVRAPVAIVGSEEALAELERVTKRMRERDAYLAELEAAYAQRSDALLKAEAEIEKLRTELTAKEARLLDVQQRLLERGGQPSRSSHPPAAQPRVSPVPPGPQSSNDLTRIKGIGPGYARALYALGVSSFAKIAAWTPEDVATFGKKLKTPAGRIERDRWIEQARDLIAADKA